MTICCGCVVVFLHDHLLWLYGNVLEHSWCRSGWRSAMVRMVIMPVVSAQVVWFMTKLACDFLLSRLTETVQWGQQVWPLDQLGPPQAGGRAVAKQHSWPKLHHPATSHRVWFWRPTEHHTTSADWCYLQIHEGEAEDVVDEGAAHEHCTRGGCMCRRLASLHQGPKGTHLPPGWQGKYQYVLSASHQVLVWLNEETPTHAPTQPPSLCVIDKRNMNIYCHCYHIFWVVIEKNTNW